MPRPLVVSVIATAALLTLLLWGPGGAEIPGRASDADHRTVAAAGLRTGTVSERPSGTLVFMSGSNRLTAIDVASGRRTARTMSSAATCAAELYVTGGRVVFTGVHDRRTTVFSVPVALDEPPTRLGAAHMWVPSAREGRVWLAGTDCTQTEMVGAREVTVDGRVITETHGRVPGDWVDGAVDAGLVIVRDRALAVWEPGTGDIGGLALQAAGATRGSLLAGCSRRSRCRDLVIFDTQAAKGRVARPRHGYRLDLAGAFSPDGSLLAAPATAHRRWRVALVDTRTADVTLVPGSGTGTYYPTVSWASTGWLYVAGRGRRIMAYRPGSPRAIPLRVRAPQRAVAFAAG